jgi:hypothetical protein
VSHPGANGGLARTQGIWDDLRWRTRPTRQPSDRLLFQSERLGLKLKGSGLRAECDDRFVPSLIESRQKVLAWDRVNRVREKLGTPMWTGRPTSEASGVGTVSVQL